MDIHPDILAILEHDLSPPLWLCASGFYNSGSITHVPEA